MLEFLRYAPLASIIIFACFAFGWSQGYKRCRHNMTPSSQPIQHPIIPGTKWNISGLGQIEINETTTERVYYCTNPPYVRNYNVSRIEFYQVATPVLETTIKKNEEQALIQIQKELASYGIKTL